MPSLLPFDINQLKASLHLLLHLFSSALTMVSSACPGFYFSALSLSVSIYLIQDTPTTVFSPS